MAVWLLSFSSCISISNYFLMVWFSTFCSFISITHKYLLLFHIQILIHVFLCKINHIFECMCNLQSNMEQSGKIHSPTDSPWKLILNVSIQRSFTTSIIIFLIIHQLLLLYSYDVLWVIIPCHLVGGYWHFGDKHWHHF